MNTVGKSKKEERGKVEHVTTEISKDILVRLIIFRCMLRTFQIASKTVQRTLTTRNHLMSSEQIAKRMKSTKVSSSQMMNESGAHSRSSVPTRALSIVTVRQLQTDDMGP